jgi:hypothetical protein
VKIEREREGEGGQEELLMALTEEKTSRKVFHFLARVI